MDDMLANPIGCFPKFKEIGEVYSNFDHILNDEIANQLTRGCYLATHPGWNFYGRIIYKDGKFIEMVMVFGNVVEFIVGENIKDVIEETNRKYGSD